MSQQNYNSSLSVLILIVIIGYLNYPIEFVSAASSPYPNYNGPKAALSSANGVLNCGGLICLRGSERCTVKSETTASLREIITTKTCYDPTGHIKNLKKETKKNPRPGKPFHASASTSVHNANKNNGLTSGHGGKLTFKANINKPVLVASG